VAVRGEGRRAQLLVLSLAFVAMFASAPGQSFLIAVFVDEILDGAGISRTAFAGLYAGATVVSASAMMVVGRAADRSGLRAVWIVVGLGLALACALASVIQGLLLAFVALALLRTFGQGSFPLVATLLVNRWFGGRRGQAMAVASFGLTAAGVVLPPLVVLLVIHVGWENAYRILGLALLAVVLPLAILVREPSGGRGRIDLPVPGAGRFPRGLRSSRRLPRLTLPTRRAARLLLVLSASPLILTAVIFHAVSLLGARGLSLTEAGLALSLLGLASAAGTVAGGAVADRISTRALLSGTSALLAASVAILIVHGRPAAYLAFVVLGFAGGLFGIASGIVWARTYGLEQLGRLQGASFAVQIAAAAAGPLPLALSLAAADSYTPALIGLAAYGGLTLAVALRWRDPRAVRRRYSSRPST
jgi:MFS family permease